ncbi:MAG: hypothetical protein KDF65_00915 [Anaerolineae bacterium]|nr:hypothetical protein [Anaerolineae bacterium]
MRNPLPRPREQIYEIRVEGHLEQRRLSAFEQLQVSHLANGETALTGPLPDQSALYGLLNWLRDLGIPLVSVNRLSAKRSKI